jgi:dihydrofolate reductase
MLKAGSGSLYINREFNYPNRSDYCQLPKIWKSLTKLHLIDEYQLAIQPIILGSGLALFKNISARVDLKLLKTKTFGCGAVTLYYNLCNLF